MLTSEITGGNKSGIEVKSATYDSSTHMSEMHYHNTYEILHVTKNSRILTVGNAKYKLDSSNVALIPPFIPHMTSSAGQFPEKRILIAFHEHSIHNIKKHLKGDIMSCFTSPCNIIPIKGFEDDFCYLLDKLSANKGESLSELEEDTMLLSLCSLISLLSKNSNAVPSSGSFFEIVKFVEESFDQKITLELLANRFFMSKFTISRCFAKYTGSSLPKYVNTIRIINAKKHLEGGFSVTETAMLCGFDNTTAFDRVFTAHEGMSPSKYKKLSQRSQ